MEVFMKRRRLIFLFSLMTTMTVLIFAQGPGKGQGPRYNPAAEVTLSGTIDDIKTMDSMCHTGTHLILKTDKGNIEVALGPSQFLNDQKFELKKGDQIQVVGAKTNTRNGEMFVARQITSGGKNLTLRDGQGVPVWPRGMCQQP
jgi:hypothetical protein